MKGVKVYLPRWLELEPGRWRTANPAWISDRFLESIGLGKLCQTAYAPLSCFSRASSHHAFPWFNPNFKDFRNPHNNQNLVVTSRSWIPTGSWGLGMSSQGSWLLGDCLMENMSVLYIPVTFLVMLFCSYCPW